MQKYGQNNNLDALNETYAYDVGSVFPQAPYLSADGVQTLLTLAAQTSPSVADHKQQLCPAAR